MQLKRALLAVLMCSALAAASSPALAGGGVGSGGTGGFVTTNGGGVGSGGTGGFSALLAYFDLLWR